MQKVPRGGLPGRSWSAMPMGARESEELSGSVGTGWWVNRLTVSKSIRVMRKTARKPSFGENDPEHKPFGVPEIR